MLAGCASAPRGASTIESGIETTAITRPLSYPLTRESFVWPVQGQVISQYGSKVDRIINKGIDIKAEEGQSVRAAKGGRVVYTDSHQKGFGKTVILDHGDRCQTVYSYNSEILVRVGDEVKRGEAIARVGSTGRAKAASLHFEIRRDGEPQNPVNYLGK